MGKITRALEAGQEVTELLARLSGQSPQPKYIRSADESLELWPLTSEQLDGLARNLDKRPKPTMDRFAAILGERGLQPVGTVRDIERSTGPTGGISEDAWDKVLRWHSAPRTAQLYVVDPVAAVASQYPAALRGEAIAAARAFRMPLRSGGTMQWQQALHTPDPKSVVVAYPGRQRMQSNAAGLAHAGARGELPGWVDVAAGKNVDRTQFDKVLLHELRHTLEGGALGNHYSYGGYQDVRYPKSAARLSPSQNEYLGRTAEEVARFADGRARYAQRTGRLIADPDEAERAATMILSNEHGIGSGFYPTERYFYRTARELSPLIREHQNALLQGLLSVPAVIGAGAMQDQQ